MAKSKTSRGINVKVITGEDELLRKLKALGDLAIGDMLTEAVTAAAQPVVAEAKARAPERTGNLREHIQTGDVTRAGFRTEIPVGVDQKKAFYGPFVEVGHVIRRGGKIVGRVPAHPFLRPALTSKRREIRKIVSKVVKERIEKVARS